MTTTRLGVAGLRRRGITKATAAVGVAVCAVTTILISDLRGQEEGKMEIASRGVDGGKRQLEWEPSDRPQWHSGGMNAYVRGIHLLLEALQGEGPGTTPIDYETVSGDLGVAFLFHASEGCGEDPGYWPIEPVLLRRLEFLSRTTGYELRHHDCPNEAKQGGDPKALYREWFEPEVRASIDAGRPCILTLCPQVYVVSGYDTEAGWFTGALMGGDEKPREWDVSRPPWKMIVPVGPTPRISRAAADLNALCYAIDLHYDRDREISYWRRYTGQKAFVCWLNWLRNDKLRQDRRCHFNVLSHLEWNRRCAIRYLEAMQKRHNEPISSFLGQAVGSYSSVVREAQSLRKGTGEELSPQERSQMIEHIQAIVESEKVAIAALEQAVAVFDSELRANRPVTGRCHCGRIAYEALVKEFTYTSCHCRACQQATGGMQTANVDVPPDKFRIVHGQPTTYKSATGAACDKGTWSFCSHCGCTLFWRDAAGTVVAISAGSLDDAGVFRERPDPK